MPRSPSPVHTRRLPAMSLLAACMFAAPSAFAQYDPGASADLGANYGQIALSQSVLDNTRAIEKGKAKPGANASRNNGTGLSDAQYRALLAEYDLRVRRDGQESANAWAREMGRRESERRKAAQR